MKLHPLNSVAQKLIESIMRIDTTGFCRHGEFCPEHLIAVEVQSALDSTKGSFLQKDIDFIKSVISCQTDGRSCNGNENQRRLKMILNDDWRTDTQIVHAGIHYGLIRLSKHDLDCIRNNHE